MALEAERPPPSLKNEAGRRKAMERFIRVVEANLPVSATCSPASATAEVAPIGAPVKGRVGRRNGFDMGIASDCGAPPRIGLDVPQSPVNKSARRSSAP